MDEQLKATLIHTAPCEQKEPIEWYVQEGGYQGQKCKLCGSKNPGNKVILLSPTQETNFPYGTTFVCDLCVPNMEAMAKTDRYYDLLFGPIKN
ncbi:hypothetical protein AUK18_00900 [Candidatus Beckwithbacteria bacterium CG2_30_44_31]|uniref:Uncharacterized protein n=1 Tax=Candidatus Beckwithbacteria bacterium CG2_30_44_31 TaxID=1805035 RepID=A0A1J5AY46_9BACT|nr:MAG: hypothetical protein AUK18_00900 [Candidatus Beckwithbacteria bacterium CG2_30_44_31]